MHKSSNDLCRRFVEEYLTPGMETAIADVGAYNVNGCYRPLCDDPEWTYTGFDSSEGPNVDVVLGSAERWELPLHHHDAFDIVISGQTLEHVRRPWVWIHDVVSLAKPGGIVWICAPNNWGFHEYPIDCWRVWPEGMRALFEDAELRIIDCDMIGADTFAIGEKV